MTNSYQKLRKFHFYPFHSLINYTLSSSNAYHDQNDLNYNCISYSNKYYLNNCHILKKYYSTGKNSSNAYCSIPHLLSSIDSAFNNFHFLFPSLNQNHVISINKILSDGLYNLSPVQLFVVTKDGKEKRVSSSDQVYDTNTKILIKAIPEDELVLTGLGLMLQMHIILSKVHIPNSVGLISSLEEYYDIVCSHGNVMRVYKLDLKNSFLNISRDRLYHMLSTIVLDKKILQLLEQFINLPIPNNVMKLNLNFPATSLLCEVLINFYLIDFDMAFQRVFPEFNYNRYVHEIIISFPTSSSMNRAAFDLFESKLLGIFDQLNIIADYTSIGPGDAPTTCFSGHLICLNYDGSIDVKEKNVIQ